MKNQNVGAFGKLHPNGVGHSGSGVVFGELGAKAAGLDADHGVQLWVEIRLTAENLRGDLVFLQGNAGMLENVVGEIAEQFTQGLRTVQRLTSN
jgi:hypothetical protein